MTMHTDDGRGLRLSVQDLLNTFPHFAMVLTSRHEVVAANTLYMQEAEHDEGFCAVSCFETVHGMHAPPAGCPLKTALLTGHGADSVVRNPDGSSFVVTVMPIPHASDEEPLFLHLARPSHASV